MYADDTEVWAETPNDLQCILNSLHMYFKEWNLTVNTDKLGVTLSVCYVLILIATCDHWNTY